MVSGYPVYGFFIPLIRSQKMNGISAAASTIKSGGSMSAIQSGK
jgi:hypothetical protein